MHSSESAPPKKIALPTSDKYQLLEKTSPTFTVITTVPTFLVNSSYTQTSSHSGFSGAHICKPFKEPRNRFLAWRAESIPGLPKRLQIRAQMSLLLVHSSFQFARLSISPSHFELSQYGIILTYIKGAQV